MFIKHKLKREKILVKKKTNTKYKSHKYYIQLGN